MFCLERGVDNSQGLEDLIHEYFELKDKQEQEVPTFKTPEINTSNSSDSKESPRRPRRPDNRTAASRSKASNSSES